MKHFYIFITIFILSYIQLIAQTTDVVTGLNRPNGILLNGNDLYISEYYGDKISKIDITDTTPTTTDVVTGLNGPNGILLSKSPDGNILYIAELGGGKISKIDITATMPTTTVDVVIGMNTPYELALNDTDLYIADFEGGKIYKIDITDPTPTTAVDVVTGLSGPFGLVLNGNDLYITEFNGGKISKIDITATTPTTAVDVVTGLNGPTGILLNGNDLYIAEFLGNKVIKFDIQTLSITENLGIQNINIYPNPSSDFIQISGITGEKSYRIYNTLGAEVVNGFISNNERIGIQGFATGVYFLNITTNNGLTMTKKVIKE